MCCRVTHGKQCFSEVESSRYVIHENVQQLTGQGRRLCLCPSSYFSVCSDGASG